MEATPESPLLLLPSAYVWPHVRVNCDPPWPLALLFPASFVAADARRTPAPEPLVAALRAAGDPVRLQVLRLVTQRPRTTEELAPLVGLSVSGLSKHLRALTEAQLVTSSRDGWYVLYSAPRGRLEKRAAERGPEVTPCADAVGELAPQPLDLGRVPLADLGRQPRLDLSQSNLGMELHAPGRVADAYRL